MLINTVSATEEQPIVPAVTPTPAADDSAALKAELETAKSRLAEQQRVADFWYEQRTAPPAPVYQAEAEPEPEDEEVDMIDLLATKGAKGLDAILAKRGYVRAAEVDQRVSEQVNARATQLTTENQLLTRYPDLNDKKSEFFLATARAYGSLISEGVPQTVAMRLAAERAEGDQLRAGKTRTPAAAAAETREASRLARINAQSGDRNSRATETDEDDDTMTAYEKHICEAMGITEEAYIARARSGVQVTSKSAIPSNRRKAA